MVRRPQTLQEVAADTNSRAKEFEYAISEFLDAFYLDHPFNDKQQARIDGVPEIVRDPRRDAWLGAVGEHLARRWGLSVAGQESLARPDSRTKALGMVSETELGTRH